MFIWGIKPIYLVPAYDDWGRNTTLQQVYCVAYDVTLHYENDVMLYVKDADERWRRVEDVIED